MLQVFSAHDDQIEFHASLDEIFPETNYWFAENYESITQPRKESSEKHCSDNNGGK